MTKEARAEAIERCEKATPGPWVQFSYKYGYLDNGHVPQQWTPFTQDDELFTESARTDLPAALSALDAADREIKKLKEELRDARRNYSGRDEAQGWSV